MGKKIYSKKHITILLLSTLMLTGCSDIKSKFDSIFNFSSTTSSSKSSTTSSKQPDSSTSSVVSNSVSTSSTTSDTSLNSNSSSDNSNNSSLNDSDTSPLSIHFLELGNQYTGDSIYIKAGDIDILVDAGSRQNSAPAIEKYVDQYCTDKKLEYVFVTHAHQDHIAAFVDTAKTKGILSYYQVDNIVDFALTNSKAAILTSYYTARDKLVAEGTKHYSIADCYNNENGASRTINLGKNLNLNFLYNKYYYENSSDENNYSIAFEIQQNDYHYYFTGDAEKGAETSIVQNNELYPSVLFKAAHHGSYTASNEILLDKIKPEYCVVTCVAGSDEYTKTIDNQFPSQAFINRISKFTGKVFVTSKINLDDSSSSLPMNGTVVFNCEDGINYSIHGSNNDTYLKDTDWFNSLRDDNTPMRVWPSNNE